jgi:hypothetical protein
MKRGERLNAGGALAITVVFTILQAFGSSSFYKGGQGDLYKRKVGIAFR